MGEAEVICHSADWWGNWIAIADIIITSVFGVWIACIVQKNVTKSRYIREYFIAELGEIKADYSTLFKGLYNSELSAKTISARLKILSCRISNLDAYIHDTYKIEKTLLKDSHSVFQQYVTGTDEFNDQYSSDTVKFSANTITLLTREQSTIVKAITQRVLDINSAKSKRKKKDK